MSRTLSWQRDKDMSRTLSWQRDKDMSRTLSWQRDKDMSRTLSWQRHVKLIKVTLTCHEHFYNSDMSPSHNSDYDVSLTLPWQRDTDITDHYRHNNVGIPYHTDISNVTLWHVTPIRLCHDSATHSQLNLTIVSRHRHAAITVMWRTLLIWSKHHGRSMVHHCLRAAHVFSRDVASPILVGRFHNDGCSVRRMLDTECEVRRSFLRSVHALHTHTQTKGDNGWMDGWMNGWMDGWMGG
jgi:hypothetical protein